MSETSSLLIENHAGVRVLKLNRGKANALESEFCTELHAAAREAEEDHSIRAMVLTSNSSKIFCGGFDLATLGHAAPEVFGRFIRSFETLFFDLFLFGKPLVVALTGHAVAGGALLAATSDFRIAAEGPGTMGLPEVHIGVHVPRYCIEAMRASIGQRALTHMTLRGRPVPFLEAQQLGAIDRITPPERLLGDAIGFARELGEAPGEVYAAIKRDLRGTAYEKARDILVDGRQAFVDSWFSGWGQRGIQETLAKIAHRG